MATARDRVTLVATRFLAPAGVYFGFFCFYTWPWIVHMNTSFFANDGDGLANVWNIWWVDRAVTSLRVSPWHTTMLHAPYGTTLLGQTMNPFNGFAGVVLIRAFGIVATYNTLVIFSFVFGGVSAFWLCLMFTGRYLPSLIGGFVFTFSAFHLAHAIGHMNLVSLEWMPLFVLFWWKLLTKPGYWVAIGAVAALALVLLCDYYYFVYSVVAAVFIAVYLWHKREARWSKPLLVFGIVFAVACLPLPVQLLWYNHSDKLLGSHNARIFSTDLLTPFLDGGYWRFASLTNWYWGHVHDFVSESSVYLGVAVLAVFVVAIARRNRLHRDTVFWLVFAAVFAVLSLGPRLLFHGHSYDRVPLPYALVERALPPFKLSGTPIRMMVMVTLAAAVLTAIVLARLDLSRWSHRALLAVFGVVLVLEMWPMTYPRTLATHPPYVSALARLPAGAVLDDAAPDQNRQLYFQTVHEHPIAFGYVARLPTSVAAEDAALRRDVSAQRFAELCGRYGIRYYTTPPSRPLPATAAFPVVYSGPDALIYDVGNSPRCLAARATTSR